MGEEFYASIKLVSGEEVFSLISVDENDGDPIVLLQKPVVMKLITNQNGSMIKVKPWMELTDDDLFAVKLDKIITMTECKNNKIVEVYNSYTNDDEDVVPNTVQSGKVKVSNEMGYISSVKDARKRLENLYKGIKDT
jgi:hypothetical protein